MYLERLRLIKNLCEKSDFFASHELIGSSLLFVHDDEKASVWMIDFEKTRSVGGQVAISHDKEWVRTQFKYLLVICFFFFRNWTTTRTAI